MIIGRDEQLHELHRIITRATASGATGPNVLFVTGEAGIGKTTLLRHALQQCREMASPPRVVHVECSTPLAGQDIGEVESLQPWEEIMRQPVAAEPEKQGQTRKLVADLARAWVRCVPVVGDVLESVADTAQIVRRHGSSEASAQPVSAANQGQVFQQYINFLAKLAEQRPLVLMIDDFHWADTSSTNLLFTAARQLHQHPILFIVAYRPDDAASSRNGEGHPILHIRNELERYSLAAELGVPRMNADDLDRLLHGRYPNYRDDDEFEHWLVTISSGNALFITQFLQTLEEDGYIDAASGIVHPGYREAKVPNSAYAVVRERLRRLGEETRELLRYASVEGDTFTSTVLARITETPQLKLLQRLRLAEESHRVIVNLGKQRVYASETSAWRFSHALLHLAMYDSLSEEERELLHEAIFDVLKEEWEKAKQERGSLEGIAARLAVHAEVLEEHLFAAEVLLEGAKAAARSYAHDETLRQLRGATGQLECLPQNEREGDQAQRVLADTLLLQGEVDILSGRYQDGLDRLHRARSIYEMLGDDDDMFEAMAGEGDALRYLSRFDELEQLARLMLEKAEEKKHDTGMAQALNTMALMLQTVGRNREAIDYLEQTMELWRKLNNVRGQAIALNNLSLARTMLGEREGVIEAFNQAAGLARQAGNATIEAMAIGNVAVTLYQTERFEEALDYLYQSQAIYQRIGNRADVARTYVNLGLVHAMLDRNDEALEELNEGLKVAREIGYELLVARALVNVSNVYRARKEYDRALECCRESLTVAEAIDSDEERANALEGIGMLSRETGDLATAHTSLNSALKLIQGLGMKDGEAKLLGEIGLTLEEEAKREKGEKQQELYNEAITLLQQAIEQLRDSNPSGVEECEDALSRIHSALSLHDSTDRTDSQS